MRNAGRDLHCSNFNSLSLLYSDDASVAVTSEVVPASRKNNADSVGVHWYVVHTRPRQEERANNNLIAWNVDTFLPQLKQRSGPRGTTWIRKPMFPGYLFARFNPGALLAKVNFTRGVQCVVSFGGFATRVDDAIIERIREQIGEDGFVSLFEEFATGNKVKINFGPLKDLEGVFESGIKDTDRVRILLDAVSYQSHVVIERHMIEKIA